MSYFVPAQPTSNQVSQAINYALANLGGSVSSNLVSGQINAGGTTIGYLYQYMDVAFATAFDGSSGFSTTSYTNATYFGLRNTNSTTVSTNPTDYVWYQVAGSGFGTTENLWYNVTGGRNIQFQVSATAPAGYYEQWTFDPINLDIVTSTIGVKNNILSIYQWTNGTVPSRPTTTSTYTWATNTFTPVPTGWSATLPSNTTAGDILFEIQINLSVGGTTLTSLLDWTNTSYPIIAVSANGINGVTGTRTAVITMYQWAASAPTVFPTGTSTYTWATGVYTAATNPNGWTITPGTSVAGDILYACDAIFSDNTTSATSTITWSTSSAYSIGASGVNGQRTAVIQLYQWSATAPSAYPSGTSTYTWATGTFTAPATLNGWTVTPGAPVAGDILYTIDQIVTDNLTTPTTTVTWSATTEYAIGLAGTNGSAGSNGLSSLYGYLVQNQSLSPPTFTSTTTGSSLPSGWTSTPPTVSVGQVFWYIFGQYNSSSITINGIAPNTTYWTGPTAASVFQDIESDNWNGSVPPTYGTPSTYGTTGYYISRNTGNVYFNNGIFRGDITGASGTFSGSLSGATGTFAGSLSAATGSFAGSLSSATGSFSGSLSAATGSFTGTLSTGSSPPVINSSTHTISSGAGALINSNGTFALGSTTSNIVDDGTGVYLNGFVYGNSSSYAATAIGATASPIIMPVSPGTFTVTKTGNVIISSIGSIQLNANISSLANVPNVVFGTIPFQILNSSSTVIASLPYPYNNSMINYTSVYSGSSPYDALATIPFNFSTLVALTPGTYTLIVNGSQFYSDALYYQNSSSYTTRNVTSLLISASATLFANSYWYQIG